MFAGAPIELIVSGKCLLELKGDALPHHTCRIDGVDERVDVGVQDVPLRQLNHRRLSAIPRTLDRYHRAMFRASKNLIHLFGQGPVDHPDVRDQFQGKKS